MGRAPDFIIVGASRSGTSTLHGVLSQHDQIFMPGKKELQFFWNGRLYQKGLGWYEGFFDGCSQGQICGEASPPYFHEGITLGPEGQYQFDSRDDPARRIRKHYPDVKLVFSLRSPITRAHSQFWKNVWQGDELAENFEAAIAEERTGKRKPESSNLCWLYRNDYARHVGHWLSLFPKEQCFFMVFEEWTKSPATAAARLEAFLGVAPSGLRDDDVQTLNAGRSVHTGALRRILRMGAGIPGISAVYKRFATRSGTPDLSDETCRELEAYFEDSICKLEEMVDLPLRKYWLSSGSSR